MDPRKKASKKKERGRKGGGKWLLCTDTLGFVKCRALEWKVSWAKDVGRLIAEELVGPQQHGPVRRFQREPVGAASYWRGDALRSTPKWCRPIFGIEDARANRSKLFPKRLPKA